MGVGPILEILLFNILKPNGFQVSSQEHIFIFFFGGVVRLYLVCDQGFVLGVEFKPDLVCNVAHLSEAGRGVRRLIQDFLHLSKGDSFDLLDQRLELRDGLVGTGRQSKFSKLNLGE